MYEDPVDPEDCLRSLTAEALSWAHPDRPLFPVSLGLMAVANAFVMLGPPGHSHRQRAIGHPHISFLAGRFRQIPAVIMAASNDRQR
jgi:hypothetical protein